MNQISTSRYMPTINENMPPPTKTFTGFHSSVICKGHNKKSETTRCPLADDKKSKMCCIHTIKHYSVIKKQ